MNTFQLFLGAGIVTCLLIFAQYQLIPECQVRDDASVLSNRNFPCKSNNIVAASIRWPGGKAWDIQDPDQVRAGKEAFAKLAHQPRFGVLSDLVASAIPRLANYLVRVCDSDGRFAYRLNPGEGMADKYNELRHSGSVFALSEFQLYQYNYLTQPALAPSIIDSIIHDSAQFQCDTFVLPITPVEKNYALPPMANDGNEGRPMLGVWSIPEVVGAGDYRKIKAGGCGLGLVSLLHASNAMQTFRDFNPSHADNPISCASLKSLRGIGNFLLYLQRKDGSFVSKYAPTQGGMLTDWQSLYYPGEAALGLMNLYLKDPQDKWIQAAIRALLYLSTYRKGQLSTEPDHWALIATSMLLRLNAQRPEIKKFLPPETHTTILAHAIQVSKSIYRGQVSIEKALDPLLEGGFDKFGRTTPTATRLEGLVAILEMLRNAKITAPQILQAENLLENNRVKLIESKGKMASEPLPDAILGSRLVLKLERIVEDGIRFILRSEIRGGPTDGCIPRGVLRNPAGQADKEFQKRATECRIDYIQHALSAMIHYHQYHLKSNSK